MKISHFQEKVVKFIFECIVVICCLTLSKHGYDDLLEIADIVLLVFLCVTLSANIINVIRHKVHYDKETVRKERTAAEVGIIGLIVLMMSFSLSNKFFDLHIQVTPKLTDIILYSVLALRDGVYIFLSLRKKEEEVISMNSIYDEEKNFYERGETSKEKKKVFLLGDSIRVGYCGYTKEALKDVADVLYPEENCRYTQYTYVELRGWKNIFENGEEVDIICWNNGHWDVAKWDGADEPLNSKETYSDMLIKIYKKLKTYFPNAKIMFLTTSPMNPNGAPAINARDNNIISEYNEVAVKTLTSIGVDIVDVYDYLKDFKEDMFSDYCHLKPDGFKLLGEYVAKEIKEKLNLD